MNRSGADTLHQSGGLPVVRPWVMMTTLGTGNRLVFERNPYFFKVDENGSQLPYIDRVVFDIIEDPQVMLLKATNGEISYQLRHFTTPQNKPVLARSAKQKGYTLETFDGPEHERGCDRAEPDDKDPVKRESTTTRLPHRPLHALDRTRSDQRSLPAPESALAGGPAPDTKFYNEKAAEQYHEYNVELANQFLDEAGYTNRNAEPGFRLRPRRQPDPDQLPCLDHGRLQRGAADHGAADHQAAMGGGRDRHGHDRDGAVAIHHPDRATRSRTR